VCFCDCVCHWVDPFGLWLDCRLMH
jgi:hypothetical protein